MLFNSAKRSEGFTLIEILLFVGIFSLVVVAFMSIFVSVSQVTVRQSSAAEVAAQSQLLLQTIQYYVERSSFIDIVPDIETSQLTLRMSTSTEDTVYVYIEDDRVTMESSEGARYITSPKVKASNIAFTRRTNTNGHDSLAVSFVMEYNTTNIKQAFVQAFSTSVARVSAATFDSNIVPSALSTYNLGASSGDWRSINNTIFFSASKVGVGISTPSSTFQVAGGDVYVSSVPYGLVLKAPNGTSCYRLTVTNTGSLATSTVGC
jgi:type II secretory pathway pseudopilin PulG